MNTKSPDSWQQRLQETAASFAYPPTPDVSSAVRQRLPSQPLRSFTVRPRLAWAAALLVVILAGLLAVPQVRAAVWRIIRAGAITITHPESTLEPAPEAALSVETPLPAGAFIFDLAEPSTLAEARARALFPLKLPTYPDDLGRPDRVYIQESEDLSAIIMVWMKPGTPGEALLSLYHIEVDDYAYKEAETIIVDRVNGREAFWLEAPHYFRLDDGREVPWNFVEGSVLIWYTPDGVTYRLESGTSLLEARRIAESLK